MLWFGDASCNTGGYCNVAFYSNISDTESERKTGDAREEEKKVARENEALQKGRV